MTKLSSVTQLSETQLQAVFNMTAKAIGRLVRDDQPVVMDLSLSTNEIIIFSKSDVYLTDKLKWKDNLNMTHAKNDLNATGVTQ